MSQFVKELARQAAGGPLPEPVAARRAQQSSPVVPVPTAPIVLPAWPMDLSSPEREATDAAAKAVAPFQLLSGTTMSSIPSLPKPPAQYRLGVRGPAHGGSLRTTSHSAISMALELPVSVAVIPSASLPISATTVTPVVPLPLPPKPKSPKPKAPKPKAPKPKAPPKKRGRPLDVPTAIATNQAQPVNKSTLLKRRLRAQPMLRLIRQAVNQSTVVVVRKNHRRW
jgi:hypothetical protein